LDPCQFWGVTAFGGSQARRCDGGRPAGSVRNFGELPRNLVISPPPKFENFGNNNLNIFKSIFKNNLKMNFGRNFAKFGDFGHVRIFLTNEIQNRGSVPL